MGRRTQQKLNTSLKKGDDVVVIAGRDRGKRGKILQVQAKNGKVLVEGANMVSRHTKPTQDSEGGIIPKEAPIHASNVMVVDPASGKGSRIRKKVLGDGKKVRVAVGSGEMLDS